MSAFRRILDREEHPIDLNEKDRRKYLKGYEQAEKDLVLTGEDIAKIEQITYEYGIEIADEGFPIPWNSPEFYDEVARRYNDSK